MALSRVVLAPHLHFLMLATAEMPTNVLPAPHGSTMNPDRARPWLNILDSDFSCPRDPHVRAK
eukprot:1276180-Rhodomonas_salina.7